MSRRKQRKLDTTIAAIRKQHGPRSIQRGMTSQEGRMIPALSTGFPLLDTITGCGGLPLGEMSLISGRTTSGKLTLAYKTLAHAQNYRTGDAVAILDLARSVDIDYLARCGVDPDRLLIVRPQIDAGTPDLLADLARGGHVRAILVDSLGDLLADHRAARRLQSVLGSLQQALRATRACVIFIHELEAPWQRWPATRRLFSRSWPIQQRAALHVEMQRERWLQTDRTLSGYQARACVVRSRWRFDRPCAPVEIEFNGSVRARTTW